MATNAQLPCDGDGICMACKKKPSIEETLTCKTCTTPWHLSCLAEPFDNVANIDLQWSCPDCNDVPQSSSIPTPPADPTICNVSGGGLVFNIRAIEADQTLTEQQKDKRRQEVLAGEAMKTATDDGGANDVHNICKGNLKCSICMSLFDRPVTTPCGHNFCLKCFQRWTRDGNPSCANCRESIPGQMIKEPKINLALDFAIRMAKMSKAERTKRSRKANACSGRFFVTIPLDHFGPILAEHDPERNQGVLVGESWESRHECKQWGVHFPQVAGSAGQSEHGAQSVVLSGEYDDDEDHGEWFLYTGRGGRDLSQNRTTKKQSSDQKFEKVNEALRVSCIKGYPVRVVRSNKDKHSRFAPESGLRYDGIYRIEKCWRKVGKEGFKMCRYLFVRCDNDAAPWTSNHHGDYPRPSPVIDELEDAGDITVREGPPSWDFDDQEGQWIWKIPPPPTKKPKRDRNLQARKNNAKTTEQKLLKELGCLLCAKVLASPVTTLCGHNFCKVCLDDAFTGQGFIRQRTCVGGWSLRPKRNVMKCPSCGDDISDIVQKLKINIDLTRVIEFLQQKVEEDQDEE